MKRIVLACFLLTAVCTTTQRAAAQVTHISAPTFLASVNQLDSYIGASDLTDAKSTWDSVNRMMICVLSYTKNSIMTAATPADKAAFTAIMHTQRDLYRLIYPLRADFVTNRTALHAKLVEFDGTIY